MRAAENLGRFSPHPRPSWPPARRPSPARAHQLARARACSAASAPSPARPAITGTGPAVDTRFGSSKQADFTWQTRTYRMPFSRLEQEPQQVVSSQVRMAFASHDARKDPTPSADPGSGVLAGLGQTGEGSSDERQLARFAVFDDCTVVEHEHLVGVGDGGQSVSDGDRGASLGQGVEGCL